MTFFGNKRYVIYNALISSLVNLYTCMYPNKQSLRNTLLCVKSVLQFQHFNNSCLILYSCNYGCDMHYSQFSFAIPDQRSTHRNDTVLLNCAINDVKYIISLLHASVDLINPPKTKRITKKITKWHRYQRSYQEGKTETSLYQLPQEVTFSTFLIRMGVMLNQASRQVNHLNHAALSQR